MEMERLRQSLEDVVSYQLTQPLRDRCSPDMLKTVNQKRRRGGRAPGN